MTLVRKGVLIGENGTTERPRPTVPSILEPDDEHRRSRAIIENGFRYSASATDGKRSAIPVTGQQVAASAGGDASATGINGSEKPN